MTENFPKLMSDTKPQNQEAQRTPSRINANKQKTNNYTKVYKGKEKNPEKKYYLQRKKDKNYTQLLFRKNASKKRVE